MFASLYRPYQPKSKHVRSVYATRRAADTDREQLHSLLAQPRRRQARQRRRQRLLAVQQLRLRPVAAGRDVIGSCHEPRQQLLELGADVTGGAGPRGDRQVIEPALLQNIEHILRDATSCSGVQMNLTA